MTTIIELPISSSQIITDSINFNIKKGFTNFGNTCFYNSTLQCIFRCELLIETLKNYNGTNQLLKFLSITIKDYFFDNSVIRIGPSLLLRSYRQMNSNFQMGSQEDAHECLTYFLDNFDMATKSEGLNITQLFDYNLISQLTCPKCSFQSESKSNDKIIVLPIKNYTTFEDAFANFLSIEQLSDDNLWKCDNCKQNVAANKKLVIKGSPKYMFIALKRFEHEYIKAFNKIKTSKITNSVTMPSNININNTSYEMKGCIIHLGGLNGGHYVYFHKFENSWSKFNDDNVSSENDVDNIKNSGYIYLYQKI